MGSPTSSGTERCLNCKTVIEVLEAKTTYEGNDELYGITIVTAIPCPKCKQYAIAVAQSVRKDGEKLFNIGFGG